MGLKAPEHVWTLKWSTNPRSIGFNHHPCWDLNLDVAVFPLWLSILLKKIHVKILMLAAQTCSGQLWKSPEGQAPCGRHATRAVGGALPKTGTAPWLGGEAKKLFPQGLGSGLMMLYCLSFFVFVIWLPFLLVTCVEIIINHSFESPSLNPQIPPAVWGSKVIQGSFLRTSQLAGFGLVLLVFGTQSWGNPGNPFSAKIHEDLE